MTEYLSDDWPALPPLSALTNRVHNVSALDLLAALPDGCVDLIATDLPYSTTELIWDELIPFVPMWKEVERVLTQNGVFVTTSSQPFTSELVMSNRKMFRYEWIWSKSNGGGFLNANRQPLKRHENILVFSKSQSIYNPQFEEGEPYTAKVGAADIQVNNGGKNGIVGHVTVNDGWRYPTSILHFPNDTGLHPTQKPLALYEYLINTYTVEGQLVLDFCCGSGTTPVAAQALKRNFIACDITSEYVAIARNRLVTEFGGRKLIASSPVDDLPLFAADPATRATA